MRPKALPVHEDPDSGDEELSHDDDRRDADGCRADEREPDERRQHQRLVGQRVEDHAVAFGRPAAAGQNAVQRVRHRREAEEHERERALPVTERDEDRYAGDGAEERQPVRDGHCRV